MDKTAAKGELRRLEMARFDIKAALELCELLRARNSIDGFDWGPTAWGLWTGVVCSYARPFKKAKLSLDDKQWQTFPNSDLQDMHDQLIKLRDTLFAHNQPTPDRSVIVRPPGSWGPQGTATEEQTALSFHAVALVDRLCRFQLDRITPRVEELVAEVCDGLEYGEGAMPYLSDIPDRI